MIKFILYIASTIVQGLMALAIYNWFILPLGGPQLTLLQVIGLTLLVSYLQSPIPFAQYLVNKSMQEPILLPDKYKVPILSITLRVIIFVSATVVYFLQKLT